MLRKSKLLSNELKDMGKGKITLEKRLQDYFLVQEKKLLTISKTKYLQQKGHKKIHIKNICFPVQTID